MGLLLHMPRRGRSSHGQDGSTASEAVDVHGMSLVYCRQCAAWADLSATRSLSTHPTSGGLVPYFRCPAGHADFYQTPAEAPRSSNGNARGH